MNKKVIVGLSGGVDSAMAATLLLEQGYEVTGVTMRLWKPGKYRGGDEGSCFGPGEEKSIASASQLASALNIPYHVFDVNQAYERLVIDYFRNTYLQGHTPNPCVQCNALVKFGLLPQLAKDAGIQFDYFATGHYARIEKRQDRYWLLRATDLTKDQSYFLYRLSQEQLAHTLFPLGETTKTAIRAAARERKLIVADRPDSQDFCVGGQDELIGRPDLPGEIVDLSGKVLGHHRGFWHYTIGQRKGLGIGGAGEPYYVLETNACRNQVIVGRAEETVSTSLTVQDLNYVGLPPETTQPIPCRVKVRSAGRLVDAVLTGNHCTFPAGIRGVATGQSAVFYELTGDGIIAGGIIANSPPS